MNNYKKNTAGSLMVNNVPIVDKNISVNEVEEKLIKYINNFSTINYIYIVNKQKKLIKVVSIKELFRSDKNIIVKNLPSSKLITVLANTNKEIVSTLALNHSLKAVPVVNKEKILLGIVPSDAILQILQDKATEDLLKISGVTLTAPYKNKIFSLSLFSSLKHRLPWLIFGLLGGFIMALTVGYFEDFLSQNIILAAFIPLILYMSNAVGAQTQSFIIRDLALEPKLKFIKYLSKQLVVVIIMSLFISLILYVG
jgi:magnesium transporter